MHYAAKTNNKRAESANLKDIAFNKLYCRLTVRCSEIPAATEKALIHPT